MKSHETHTCCAGGTPDPPCMSSLPPCPYKQLVGWWRDQEVLHALSGDWSFGHPAIPEFWPLAFHNINVIKHGFRT